MYWQTVDIYLDNILKYSDVDCSYTAGGTNGAIYFSQYGNTTANRISYIDWFKAGSSLICGTPIDLSGLTQIKFDIRSSRTGSNIKIGIHDSGGTTTEITPNILVADTWQEVKIDLQSVINANKDVIDSIIITAVEASDDNIFYIDNMFAYYIPLITMV